MLSEILRAAAKPAQRVGVDVDRFSISRVGNKFYLYAHINKSEFNKKKIGTYKSYEQAKAAADSILDLKLKDIDF